MSQEALSWQSPGRLQPRHREQENFFWLQLSNMLNSKEKEIKTKA
jgi:hypothetical protein